MYIFSRIAALFILITLSPLFVFLYLLVKLDSRGPFLFTQRRAGKNKKPFLIYKIRTMVQDAENKKKNILNLNEVDLPVFKIRNDPRYTRVGKTLSHIGIDELAQLINIVKGEMTFVGPRPLPVLEAKLIADKYCQRFTVLPGLTSLWVIQGSHKVSFRKWMEYDLEYVKKKSLTYDSYIFIKTFFLVGKYFFSYLLKAVLR